MKKRTVSLAFVLTLLTLLIPVSFVSASVGPLQLVAIVTLDTEPKCIAVNEATNQVYVGVEDGLIVIDGQSYAMVEKILQDVEVVALAVNPQTNRIYAAEYGDSIFVLDGATNEQLGVIPEGIYNHYEIAVNPVTNLVYIADWHTFVGYYDSILMYDGETFAEVTQVNIPGSDEHTYVERIGLAVNPETNLVYATWSGNNNLYVIDGNTHEIVDNVLPSSFSEEVTVNTYTNYIYVGDAVLDGQTLVEVPSDYVGKLEAVDSVNNFVYTTTSDTLYVLNGTTHAIEASMELDWSFSSYFDFMAVDSKNNKILLANSLENEIPVVDIPEFPALTSTLLVLFAFASAFFIYKRRLSGTPIRKQSSAR